MDKIDGWMDKMDDEIDRQFWPQNAAIHSPTERRH